MAGMNLDDAKTEEELDMWLANTLADEASRYYDELEKEADRHKAALVKERSHYALLIKMHADDPDSVWQICPINELEEHKRQLADLHSNHYWRAEDIYLKHCDKLVAMTHRYNVEAGPPTLLKTKWGTLFA